MLEPNFLFNIVPLAPLIIMSYYDLKENKIPNKLAFISIIFGFYLFLSDLSRHTRESFITILILFVFILSMDFMNLIGGGDSKAFIYLLLVMKVNIFILILILSLLTDGLMLEVKKNKTPLVPLMLFYVVVFILLNFR